jgi:uncharacterized delta-60 repeat protein
MKIILILVLFSPISFTQVTQQWVQRYDGPANSEEQASSIAIDSAGNVYVTGRSVGSGTGNDYATIKYNPTGVQQWVQRYNGPGNNTDAATSIAVDNSGNVYVTGFSVGSGTGNDYATIKYNSAGVEQWVQRYNGPGNSWDDASSVAIDSAGNVYVTGYSNGGGTGNDYATIKYNSSGVQQWVQRYNGPGNTDDRANSIAVDSEGNVYITGYSVGSGTNFDYATIKYNSSGVQQWVQRYNGPGNHGDQATSIAVDSAGNVYVTGYSNGSGTGNDYATIKYNSAGVEQWVQRYNGPGSIDDRANSIAVDNAGNVYVTGRSRGSGTNDDYATIKYNSSGVQQWVQRYNGPSNTTDAANSIAVDNAGNVYVTGGSIGSGTQYDYATIKYNPTGVQQWVQRYNGPGNLSDAATSIAVDNAGNVYVTGGSDGSITGNLDYATIKYSQGIAITNPQAGEKWIAGETDTIKWTGGQAGQFLTIEYSTDNGQNYDLLVLNTPADSNKFIWDIPKTILSTKVIIKLSDFQTSAVLAESEIFKIKPYVLTRINSTGNYEAYTKFRDPYLFGNDSISVWPFAFWQNFDYTGTDPFTGYNYILGYPVVFLQANNSDHPDWISWVRTFGISACYHNTSFPPVYSPTATIKWLVASEDWGGSCFGISTSNVLLFQHRTQFLNNYPNFPNVNPILISPDDSVLTVINELYTHQFGKEHRTYRANIGLTKTANQTLRDIKNMLIDDDPLVRTLSIVSNDATDPGGHSIMAYKVEQDTTLSNIFYVFTYDNAYPNNLDSAIIIIDTLANNNNGTWSPIYGWTNWGGTKWFYLREPAINYLVNPSLPKQNNSHSPFILGDEELQIRNTRKASILITDHIGNSTGWFNGNLIIDIPNSIPDIIENGSSGPPIGYNLPIGAYSIKISSFNDELSKAGFYTGNKSYSYIRRNAQLTESDKLFFDNGLSFTNSDLTIKEINLFSVLNETSQEKAYFFEKISMHSGDSVKIEYPGDDKIKLISYGNQKNYKLTVDLAKQIGFGKFYNESIQLGVNSSHILEPNWIDLTSSQLTIYIDNGNDGTIDDTLYVANTVDVKDEGSLLTPNQFNLAQNYPNPFNPTTTIQYSIPQRSNVTLKVYDILGNEVATLVNEERARGVYSVNFDASQLASGIYFYRIQAGSFIETKKMILIK